MIFVWVQFFFFEMLMLLMLSLHTIKYMHWIIFVEEAEGYTSLYDDNQYEEIQPEVKFEGLRSVKELLLKV